MKEESVVFRPTKVTLVAILLSSMLILMGGAAVAPALNDIKLAFPGQDFLTSLIITLPSLAVALVGYAVGIAADRYGKVKVLLLALAIFIVAGVASYFLPTLESILVARFILGIGIAGITSTVTALIAEYYAGIDRVKVLSYQSAAMGVGVLILRPDPGVHRRVPGGDLLEDPVPGIPHRDPHPADGNRLDEGAQDVRRGQGGDRGDRPP